MTNNQDIERALKQAVRKMLDDIRVSIGSEFDRNFERQAFFTEAWQRRRSPSKGNHILVQTGELRRSITSRIDGDSVIFESTLPYAAIHNEGGSIRVTAKMKRYFWARYYETRGSFKRLKSGNLSKSRQQQRLNTEADFWQAMALMKVGSEIRIPRRRFLGASPEVETKAREICERHLTEYFNQFIKNIKQ